MNLDDIRNMSDEELTKYLKKLGNKKANTCTLCDENITKCIKIDNLKTMQTKKLCGLCDKHYQELLEFLKLYDIDWS